ncbi:MAG TPA: DUF6249 domain-containing protein [Nevskia sp.]|nr:DUF6249 domain-containing protein [Nevskia sp.]
MLPILDVDSAVEGLGTLSHVSHDPPTSVAILGVLVGLVAVVLIFSTPIILVLAMLRRSNNRQKLVNDLALKLAEKGQPIPPELFLEPARQRSDARRGIIWMAVGAGMFLAGVFSGDSDLMGWGCVPLMVGVGFFVAARLEKRQQGG